MNEIIKTIKERRSIRAYESKPVEKEKIDQILECGMWGPSAKNDQKWHFTVITNKEILGKVTAMRVQAETDKNSMMVQRAKTMEDPVLYNAPLYVVITAPEDYNYADIDGSIAAHNMILTAHSLGLGSCYIGTVKILKDNKEFKRLLQVPEGHKIVITIVFGYAKEEPEPKERNRDVVSWIE
ncbi:nitroreductase family protein [Candidatus Woesearchaeota archaeon]|nr:nitroreductase family protein [Candidatus Woesearchaeota archaeon]